MASERFQRRIERLLDEADEVISQFDWEKIRQCAQAVLALDPNNSDGMGLLAAAERASSPVLAPPDTTPSVTPIQPTSFASGRYQVQRFLASIIHK